MFFVCLGKFDLVRFFLKFGFLLTGMIKSAFSVSVSDPEELESSVSGGGCCDRFLLLFTCFKSSVETSSFFLGAEEVDGFWRTIVVLLFLVDFACQEPFRTVALLNVQKIMSRFCWMAC